MHILKSILQALITLLALCVLLAYVGFPLMRSSQVWSEATVFTHGACEAFGVQTGDLCAYTGELSESFSGTHKIRNGQDVVLIERDAVSGMSRTSQAKNLTAWKTNLYGGIIMLILLVLLILSVCALYPALRGFAGQPSGWRKSDQRRA